ncbi:MAG: hypothetical protein FJX54_20195 [Alphaproteobacteria bacterium]|nr:hypothetical protein [Alphaproteobacteria bacterium]
MNLIERTSEPRELYLAWQAPDASGERFRWAVGVVTPRPAHELALRYFEPGPEFERLNDQRPFSQLLDLGYRGYPTFGLRRSVHDVGVMEAFERRIPPTSRPDFAEYRRQFRLAPELPVSTFALLALTEAKVPSDGFSLVDPLNPEAEACDLLLELAGYRYYARDFGVRVKAGDEVRLAPEPDNPKDRYAVQAVVGGQIAGYINRLQSRTFLSWLQYRQVVSVVERTNGDSQKPRAFIFVRVRPNRTLVAA